MTQATVTKRGLEDSLWSAHTGGAEQRGGTLGFAVTGPSSITSHALPGRLIHTHKELSLLYLTDPASTIYRDENSSIHSLENRPQLPDGPKREPNRSDISAKGQQSRQPKNNLS